LDKLFEKPAKGPVFLLNLRKLFQKLKFWNSLRPEYLWIAFHGILAAALGFSVLAGGKLKINTDLYAVLPESGSPGFPVEADKALRSRSAREVYILARSADFAQAKEAAVQLYRTFAEDPAPAYASGEGNAGTFERISLYVDEELIAGFSDYLHRYRYFLLDEETRDLLEKGGAETLAEEALAAAFGAFNFTPLDNIDTDPFLLADREMRYLLNSIPLSTGTLSPRNGVLAARQGETWYVMIRGTLTQAGVSLSNKESAAAKIYAAADSIEARNPGVGFVYSGVPFHSFESSSYAQREISFISTVTLLIIFLLFLCIFKSLLPVMLSMGTVLVSLLLAAGATLLVFREIHILSFVFGTALIGIGVDYSIHYCVRWWGNSGIKTGVVSRIFRGVTMSMVSSEICFAALFFAPFIILKQFAVFLSAGLFSAYLSVVCLYPGLEKREFPGEAGRRIWNPHFHPMRKIWDGFLSKAILPGLILGALVLLFINRDHVRVENNIGGLYRMSETLKESEAAAAQVLNSGAGSWYFIVYGYSPEAVLENEEILRARLKDEINKGNLKSYMAVSLFVPSRSSQKKSYEAAKRFLPLAERQFAALGFPPENAERFREDFTGAKGQYLRLDQDFPFYTEDIQSNLWIGEVEDGYFSCVLPFLVQDEAPLRAIADDLEFVFFVNKVKDVERDLDALTRMMLILFCGAYGIMGVVIFLCYPRRDALRICAVPLFLFLITEAVLAACGISLGFFSVAGIILIFGLGLDYMFYVIEGRRPEDRYLTFLAVTLSFATTALSFGALILSAFPPVYIFGLTVFTGLTAAFISVLLLRGKASSENQRISGLS
jgi:predicted exporter